MKRVKVIFVCLGNICRSPTAHAVFRNLVADTHWAEHIDIDSAGTAAYHVGKQPDMRSMAVARERGIDMSDLRARQVNFGDLIEYDYILAMDEANYADLLEMALPEHRPKIRLFLDFATDYKEREVPDPYYGGANGFHHVFDLVQNASEGLLSEINQRLKLELN